MLKTLGLEGDEQADLVNHGGPRQALHQFSEASMSNYVYFPEIVDHLHLALSVKI